MIDNLLDGLFLGFILGFVGTFIIYGSYLIYRGKDGK